MIKLWLISQDRFGGYDTYDSAVVAAKNEETARHIHLSESCSEGWTEAGWMGRYSEKAVNEAIRGKLYVAEAVTSPFRAWANPDDVEVELIGNAKPGTPAGVICASFNAG